MQTPQFLIDNEFALRKIINYIILALENEIIMKICVIDDNVEILELLKNVLEATGNEVSTADNGKDGLSLILRDKFELTILDITMPEFSGIDIVRYLDSNDRLRDTPIIFLTAASIPDSEMEKWMEKGVKVYMNKPVEFNDLFERVMEVKMA